MARPYRYTTPVRRNEAIALVADVYRQIDRDFLLADGPLMSLSPDPRLLASTWSLLREAAIAGPAPRVYREALAIAVSHSNACTFCIDAHSIMVHASGDHAVAEEMWRDDVPSDPDLAWLVAWARSGPSAGEGQAPAMPERYAAEYIGTVLVTHVINRVVGSVLSDKLLPRRIRESRVARRLAGRAFARTFREHVTPGESLPLLGAVQPEMIPAWGENHPAGVAWASLRCAAATGGELLGPDARDVVDRVVASWDGQPAGVSDVELDGWLAQLSDDARLGARIALLAALDPHRIGDADVAAWRDRHPGDVPLLRIVAFGAVAAARRIEAWLVGGEAASVPAMAAD